MPGILALLPMFQSALSVIGSFKGGPQVAKATGYVQDAVSVVTALTPLVQQWGSGQDVTEDQVRAALAGKDAALAEFDKLIATKSAPGA